MINNGIINEMKNCPNSILNKHIHMAHQSKNKLISIYCRDEKLTKLHVESFHLNIDNNYGNFIVVEGDSDVRNVITKLKSLLKTKENLTLFINGLDFFEESDYHQLLKVIRNINDDKSIKIIFPFNDTSIKKGLVDIFLSDEFFNIYIPVEKNTHTVGYDETCDDEQQLKQILSSEEHIEHLKKYHTSLYLAVSYIYKNLSNDITLEEVAKSAYVSPSHLSYLFRTKLNTKFKKVLFILRLNKAREIITHNPRVTLTNVAIQVGFYDLSHFGKIYRKYEGSNIGEFRDSVRKQS
ncbi:helix-turn-helix transcriptional regulator [Vibrio pectenicida]|uniref:Helix-turn-helix transcriptional regulator n=1 Tax=Vibrio pectenicida TaxID=62763 RepID=A0A7Y4A145_9VIBR|nr:AraC family transcriptional regulator [Vibrio pectenicida]NOH72717.1 helix-turn-helix transcriptional regulator [Vibrio pectenicida]